MAKARWAIVMSDCSGADPGIWKRLCWMADAEREPITGVWGGAPSGVQG